MTYIKKILVKHKHVLFYELNLAKSRVKNFYGRKDNARMGQKNDWEKEQSMESMNTRTLALYLLKIHSTLRSSSNFLTNVLNQFSIAYSIRWWGREPLMDFLPFYNALNNLPIQSTSCTFGNPYLTSKMFKKNKMGALTLRRYYKMRRKLERLFEENKKLVIVFVTYLKEILTIFQLIERRVFQ